MNVKKKIVLLGDGAVGKTSLIARFVLNKFSDKYIQTIGVRVSKKTVSLKNNGEDIAVDLLIWDVLGQRGFERVKNISLEGTQGALLVCDVTRGKTLESLENYWYPLLTDRTGKVPIVILANKSDLPNWEIKEEELRRVANSLNAPYFITSAKTGEHVNESFRMIAERCLEEGFSEKRNVKKIEIRNLADVVDYIMEDFSKAYGSVEDAMPILRHQIELIGMDVEHPTFEEVKELINKLYPIEADFLGEEKADRNRVMRHSMLLKIARK